MMWVLLGVTVIFGLLLVVWIHVSSIDMPPRGQAKRGGKR